MKHSCDVKKCDHGSVKYCKSCLNVYCEVCNETWTAPCTLQHAWDYQPYITWYGNTSDRIKCGSVGLGCVETSGTEVKYQSSTCTHDMS